MAGQNLTEFISDEPQVKALPTEHGGIGRSVTATTGDMLIGEVTDSFRLLSSAGVPDGFVLTMASGIPTWAAGSATSTTSDTITDFYEAANNAVSGQITRQIYSAVPRTTDWLREGNRNLYYTDARVDARIALASFTSSQVSDFYEAANFAVSGQIARIPVLRTTDSLPEGLRNLYYTNARVDARIALASFTSAQVSDFYEMANFAVSGQVTRSIQSAVPRTTDSLREGLVNLYYTNARVDARIAAATFTISQVSDFYEAANFSVSGQISRAVNASTDLISATHGGTGFHGYSIGDILYASANNSLAKLPIGSPAQVLTVSSGLPSWQTPTSGTGDPLEIRMWTESALARLAKQKSRITSYGNSSRVALRHGINFIQGTNVTLSVVDDPSNNRVNVTINSSGSGGSDPLEVRMWAQNIAENVISHHSDRFLYKAGRSGGQTLIGGIESDGSLHIRANRAPFAAANTGRIALDERFMFDQSFTLAGTLQDSIFTTQGTVTVPGGVFVCQFPAFKHLGITSYGAAGGMIQSFSPAFSAQNTFSVDSAAAGSVGDLGCYFTGFESYTKYKANSNQNIQTNNLFGYLAEPRVETSGTGTRTIDRICSYTSSPNLTGTNPLLGSWTVTNLCAYESNNMNGGSLTITNFYGLRIKNQSSGTITNKYGAALEISSGTGFWNLYCSGTAKNSLKGATRFGDNTAGTEIVEVLGNIQIGEESGATTPTTGQAIFAHASSTNLTKIQAGNATAAVTYTLPTADGSSGNVLSTNGSGVLSWSSAGSGNAIIQTKYKTGDTGRTVSATSADAHLAGFSLTANKYIVEGSVYVTASTTVPDIKIAFAYSGSITLLQVAFWPYDAGVSGTPLTNASVDHGLINTTADTGTLQVPVNGIWLVFSGFLEVSNSGTFDFKWGVPGATGTTTMKQGSWLMLTQL